MLILLTAQFIDLPPPTPLLSQDYVACGNAMAFYAQSDPTFPSTMEGRFLHSLLEACESGDATVFDERVQDYDRTKKIVGWQATLLRQVRKGMMEEPDLT